MISAVESQQRRQKFLARLPEQSIAILASGAEQVRKGDGHYPFVPESNFYYLTGFTEPDAVAVFQSAKSATAYTLFSREKNPEQEVWTGKYVGQQNAITEYGAQQAYPIAQLKFFLTEFVERYSGYIIYFLFGDQSVKALLDSLPVKLNTQDVGIMVGELRLVKSAAEIALMQRAADISSAAHQQVMRTCKSGKYEYQLEAEFAYACGLEGARFQAYPSIVAQGANACTLHYIANDQRLQDGNLVLVDAGCEYQHYASDITRTYPINGKFSAAQKSIYQLVLDTQLAIIALIKPGITIDFLQQNTIQLLTAGLVKLGILQGDVAALIQQKAYKDFYMHGVSHWLGLDTHDASPYKHQGKFRELQAGNVLTVEPGIYIAEDNMNVAEQWRGIGVRIEDDVLVTDKGHRVLSSVPKTIAELEKLVHEK